MNKPDSPSEGSQDISSFPLPGNTPLDPKTVVEAIGTFERRLSQEGQGDFPRKVRIETQKGVVMEAELISIYCDGTSQPDGTFYFSGNVRNDNYPNKTFLFGREIKNIIFL